MKILEVKSYQPIMFNKKNETFFCERGGMSNLKLEMLEGHSAVLVSCETDMVIIPFTNIAYIRPEKVQPSKAKTK